MSRDTVHVVSTGCANLASVLAALNRIGAVPQVTDRPDVIEQAELVVLPGVGAFGAAMEQLVSRGLQQVLIDRVRLDRPLLAICLGLQLLCESSDESPGVVGLGIVPGKVVRFTEAARIPQMGWNQIAPTRDAKLLGQDFFYFANSFFLGEIPAGWSGAIAEHGETFAAAIERGRILACQFHPELSGQAGLSLLDRWKRGGRGH